MKNDIPENNSDLETAWIGLSSVKKRLKNHVQK